MWLPPTPKNKNATNVVGYSPYYLGDKFQKSDVRTRFGSKNEILRLMAALHANGIEVIQDVVLSHTDRAGTTAGDLDQNPEPTFSLASNSGYKTFRYSSFATPLPEAADNGAAYPPPPGPLAEELRQFPSATGPQQHLRRPCHALFRPRFLLRQRRRQR